MFEEITKRVLFHDFLFNLIFANFVMGCASKHAYKVFVEVTKDLGKILFCSYQEML